MGQYDPYANFAYSMTGIPPAFTQNMMNVGYVGSPFASPQQTFDQQAQYMHVLKGVLDQQLGAFNNGNNAAAMPFNMRGLFNSAANVMEDPMYGIIGAPGMFSGGYKMGDLPQNGSLAGAGYWNAAHGYPGIPAPNYAFGNQTNAIGGGGGGGGTHQAAISAPDSGTHQALDSSGNVYTINKPYGAMSDAEKGQANDYAHNIGNVGA